MVEFVFIDSSFPNRGKDSLCVIHQAPGFFIPIFITGFHLDTLQKSGLDEYADYSPRINPKCEQCLPNNSRPSSMGLKTNGSSLSVIPVSNAGEGQFCD